jgi:hypothetical protein
LNDITDRFSVSPAIPAELLAACAFVSIAALCFCISTRVFENDSLPALFFGTLFLKPLNLSFEYDSSAKVGVLVLAVPMCFLIAQYALYCIAKIPASIAVLPSASC